LVRTRLAHILEHRTRDNVAAGMTIDEARRDAERRLGGRLRVHEHTHDADVLVWLESIGQDVRYAARNLRRSPLVTGVVLAMVLRETLVLAVAGVGVGVASDHFKPQPDR